MRNNELSLRGAQRRSNLIAMRGLLRFARNDVFIIIVFIGLFIKPAFAANPSIVPQDIGLDKKTGQTIPLDVPFRDETGKSVTLGDYFKDKPVILAPVYFRCPMLCTLTLNGLLRAVKTISFNAGKDYQIVVMSFSPEDKPPLALAKKDTYVKAYARKGSAAGWHFLTGDEASIRRVTDAIGFRYVRDKATGQFAHPSAVVVLTGSGKISNYFEGVEYAPKDLRLALVDASASRIGTIRDQILLFCFQHDVTTSRYGAAVIRATQILGLATVLGLGLLIFKLSAKPKS